MAFSFPVMGDLCAGTDPGRGAGTDKWVYREFYASGSNLPAAPRADTQAGSSLLPLFVAERLSPSAGERVPGFHKKMREGEKRREKVRRAKEEKRCQERMALTLATTSDTQTYSCILPRFVEQRVVLG
jgi:hypothetical protein